MEEDAPSLLPIPGRVAAGGGAAGLIPETPPMVPHGWTVRLRNRL